MELIKNLKWRYATKKYEASQLVSQDHIEYIQEAVQLAASSYGLQPYRVLLIEDPKLRKELKPLSWNQSQITDASHLFLFCNNLEVTNEDVDQLMLQKAKNNGLAIEQLTRYGEFVKGKLQEKSKIEMFHWTAKQTYIALANAINACAELKIDSTPIEGFDPEAINEHLNLHSQGLNACVMLAVGYRSPEDVAQDAKKTRKTMEDLFLVL